MKNSSRRLPLAVLFAFALALVFAASAAAEIRTGEVTAPADPSLAGEEDLIAAAATYDSVTGTLTVGATTRSAPGQNEKLTVIGGLATIQGECSISNPNTENGNSFPQFFINSSYAPTPKEPPFWRYAGSKQEAEEAPGAGNSGEATRTVEGTKTTLTAVAAKAVSGPFNCAAVGIQKEGGAPSKFLLFPIAAKVEPSPPAPVMTPAPAPAAQPAATPPAPKLVGALSFPKAAPLKLKRERWTTVRFRVSNPGNAPIGPITIKAKAPKGVHLEPVQVKLPALLPGQTWPASFRIEVTDAAKAKPKIALTATATGLSATGSVVIKPTG